MEFDVFGLSNKWRPNHYPDDYEYYEKVFRKNFVVNNVVTKIAKLFSNAIFQDENESSSLLDKINNPNDDQSKEEFLKEFAIYVLSCGYGMIWKNYKSYGGLDSLQLINLNPDKTDVRKTTLVTEVGGKNETIKLEDVIFFYDTIKTCSEIRGLSRLKTLRSQVDNIQDAQRAKGIQIENSGTTIVSPKAANQNNGIDEGLNAPVPTQIGDLKTQKEEMENRLNSRGMENRIIVSSKGVDAVNLSEKLNNVKFYEIVETDILAVYDAFGFPVELSPYGKNATFENKAVAENSLIESEVLPLVRNLTESLNSSFSNYGKINASYDHLNSVAQTKNKIHETNKTISETYTNLFEKGLATDKEARAKLIEYGLL